MQNEMQRQAQTLNEQETMTSLQIAEVAGKNHKDVLRAIREMEIAWTRITGRNFALSEYTDRSGKSNPCYQLTKTECLYIATKFNDEARARLILRWEELEYRVRQEQPKLPRAARYKGFFEWQAQVRRYIRPEDKRAIADLYGCCVSHVRKVMAGSTMSMPLARLISEYAHENYKQGIRADLPSFEFQPMLFTEAELEGCMLNA